MTPACDYIRCAGCDECREWQFDRIFGPPLPPWKERKTIYDDAIRHEQNRNAHIREALNRIMQAFAED